MDVVAKLEQHLDVLNNLEARGVKGILPHDECIRAAGQITGGLAAELPESSAAFHMHQKFLRNTMWWLEPRNGYVGESQLTNIRKIQTHIRTLIEELQPSFLRGNSPEAQYYFSPGQTFEARKKVFELMRRASSSLSIVDTYLDESIFDYLGSLDTTIDVQLLTGTKRPIFPTLLTPFRENRPNTEARECTDCHDRFLIIDGSEIWHLGTSINTIGDSATMVNKVQPSTDEYARLESDFASWWSKGAVL